MRRHWCTLLAVTLASQIAYSQGSPLLPVAVDSGIISGAVQRDPGMTMIAAIIPIVGAKLVLESEAYTILPLADIVYPGPTLWIPIDSTISGQNGAYTFRPQTAGNYRISSSASGYLPSKTFLYLSGADTTVKILMTYGTQPVTLSGKVTTTVCANGTCSGLQAVAGCSVLVSIPRVIPYATQAAIPIVAYDYVGVTDNTGAYSITVNAAEFDAGNSIQAIVRTRKSGFNAASADTSLFLNKTTVLDCDLDTANGRRIALREVSMKSVG